MDLDGFKTHPSVHSDKSPMLWDAQKMVPSVARRPSVRISHLIGRTGLTGEKYAI